MKNIIDLIDKNRKYYIYGTLSFGKYCYEKIVESLGEDTILGFIETVPKSENCCGKKIFSVSEANNENSVIITGFNGADSMKKSLLAANFKEENIIIPKGYKNYFAYDNTVQIKRLCFWPPIKEYNKDLIDKISWFIPDRIKVDVWTDDLECIEAFNENVIIHSQPDYDETMESSDYVCVWNLSEDKQNISEKYYNKIKIVDPNFYSGIDVFINYSNFYFSSYSIEEKNEFDMYSSKVFAEMRNCAAKYKRANIFCTGPSIQEIQDKTIDGFNVICNSMSKDKELLENLKPSLVTFTDAAFYVSPNEYCRAFYSDLLEGYKKYHYYIIVLQNHVPLLMKHFPELKEHLIGIKQLLGRDISFPNENRLEVMQTKNILTLMMIPVTSELFDVIGIAGCTGRSPDENYFWKHNDRTQYYDLMHCVFESYPSFFRDTRYEDYYDEHCKTLRKLIEYGQERGKQYINMTTSFIPVLNGLVDGKK